MKRIAFIILNYRTYLDTDKVTKEILSFAKNLPSFTDGCSWDSPVNDLIKVITSIL